MGGVIWFDSIVSSKSRRNGLKEFIDNIGKSNNLSVIKRNINVINKVDKETKV